MYSKKKSLELAWNALNRAVWDGALTYENVYIRREDDTRQGWQLCDGATRQPVDPCGVHAMIFRGYLLQAIEAI